MGSGSQVVLIGVTIGVAVGTLIASFAFIAIRLYRRRSQVQQRPRGFSEASIPIRANGNGTSIESSASLSYLEVGNAQQARRNPYWVWRGHQVKDTFNSISGIPRYPYKNIQKATQNFTTILGEGSFGPVYKALMPTGEVVAVKVLGDDSRQGEKEFQTEVLLLSRLHHRNLVNLVGYCVDKGQHMLIYEFMSNGSLASLLYGNSSRRLSWEERLQVALDVSHGIEYLHEGANPPVIHRDLKSANILLDTSMRAKVADFGFSKEEVFDGRKSGLKGTYGYMDPHYVTTNKFTKKSDIYSFGVILFELITALNPQQGLMEYINLAAVGGDGSYNWEEIIDEKLADTSYLEEMKILADIAYKCLNEIPRKRPSITDVTQVILRIQQRHIGRLDTFASSVGGESFRALARIELQQMELSNLASIKEHPSSMA